MKMSKSVTKKKDYHIPNEVKSLILYFVLLLGSSVKSLSKVISDYGKKIKAGMIVFVLYC